MSMRYNYGYAYELYPYTFPLSCSGRFSWGDFSSSPFRFPERAYYLDTYYIYYRNTMGHICCLAPTMDIPRERSSRRQHRHIANWRVSFLSDSSLFRTYTCHHYSRKDAVNGNSHHYFNLLMLKEYTLIYAIAWNMVHEFFECSYLCRPS